MHSIECKPDSPQESTTPRYFFLRFFAFFAANLAQTSRWSRGVVASATKAPRTRRTPYAAASLVRALVRHASVSSAEIGHRRRDCDCGKNFCICILAWAFKGKKAVATPECLAQSTATDCHPACIASRPRRRMMDRRPTQVLPCNQSVHSAAVHQRLEQP